MTYKAFDNFYHKLDTKEGEKDIYGHIRLRERRTRDLGNIKCIKSEDNMVYIKDSESNERWRANLVNLFNDNKTWYVGRQTRGYYFSKNYNYYRVIRLIEVKDR